MSAQTILFRHMTEGQLSKLPGYAQSAIDALQRRIVGLEAARDEREAAYALGEGAPIVHDVFSDRPTGLPGGAIVRFRLGSNPLLREEAYIDVRVDTNRVGSHAVEVRGSDLIVVRPHSSNVITVQVQR